MADVGTLILGVAGLVTTLGAALGAPVVSARRSAHDRLREQRTVLYGDALLHAQLLRSVTDRLVDPWYGGTVTPVERERLAKEAPLVESVSGRMLLLAHRPVHEAWADLVRWQRHLDFYLHENAPNVLYDAEESLSDDDEWVTKTRAAIDAFQTACRRALAIPD